MGVALGHVKVAIRLYFVAKWTRRQPRHPAHMASGKGNFETIGSRVGQAMHGIRPEIVILPLLPIRDDGRAGRLELLNGVPYGVFVKRIQARIRIVSPIRNRRD